MLNDAKTNSDRQVVLSQTINFKRVMFSSRSLLKEDGFDFPIFFFIFFKKNENFS